MAAPPPAPLAVKRVQKEFKVLAEATSAATGAANPTIAPEIKSVRLVSDSNIFSWNVTIAGPSGSPYEHGFFRIVVDISADYPHRAPTMAFATRLWHPGVDFTSGKICEAIFSEWAPTMTIADALSLVVDVLRSPKEHRQEVNLEALEQLEKDPAGFNKKAASLTAQHALSL